MNSMGLSELDFLMVCAAEVEVNTYGTIRMVKETSKYQPSEEATRVAQTSRGIMRLEDNRQVVEHYHFELLNPDFDDDEYALWDAIADYQELLKKLFESLDAEGVGFNPSPPEFIEVQNMTWFHPAESLSSYTGHAEFLDEAISFLKNLNTSSEYFEHQRVASLTTFDKHRCPHVWSGEPEYWECASCGNLSFLDEAPARSF